MPHRIFEGLGLQPHLGLVAGIFDELGRGEAIDRMIPQESEKRIVSLVKRVRELLLGIPGLLTWQLDSSLRLLRARAR